MNDDRPDPDALLEKMRADEARARRGKLTIYFGSSAGVGKTYAMLAGAQRARADGIDVVVGVVETHGRAETEALLAGLEQLPKKPMTYRDRVLSEFDLDAALARKPTLLLVDELAHSNVVGSRHPKRWQDVAELQDAGIDVWTTMNVQHLESLNDIVSGIAGVRVFETVPDRAFDEADEVVVVDLPPDELLARLAAGKVYVPAQAERAAKNFFRKGNLIALRELALRRTADRVDEQMLAYRRTQSGASVWPTREALLVGVGPGAAGEKLVRSAARLATQLEVPWHAVFVETPALATLAADGRKRMLRTLDLAREFGATTAVLSGTMLAPTLVRYARQHNLSRVMLGRPPGQKWWRPTLAEAVGRLGPDLDVVQVAVAPSNREPRRRPRDALRRADWRGYAAALAIVAATGLLATPLLALLELVNIVMLFLLAVVAVALWWGRGPAVLAAFVSVGTFDFFFVPPRFSFAVSDIEYLLTFGVMLAVALVIGPLTARLRYQARVATEREARVNALYQLSRELSAALMVEQVSEIAQRFVRAEFQGDSTLVLPDAADRLQAPAGSGLSGIDLGIAQWSFDHDEAAGHGTNTLPASALLYLPLKAPMRLRGVLALQANDALAEPAQRQLIETCASLLATTLERIHYIEVAQSSTVQIESERLRNSLLAALSHDLRTPLASLVGMADALALTRPPPTAEQAEIAQSLRDAALRMNALVANLLDMARLEAGELRPRFEWQPLEEVVGSAIQSLGPALRRHPVRVALPADLPLVRIDASLFERVLANLLENAAKYTPSGAAIDIGARATSDTIEVWLDDHGPGLPVGREQSIFRKFERGQKETATAGVGLGLAICRAIVEAHGGTIEGRTRDDGGARFTIALPRGEPPSVVVTKIEEAAAS